MNGCLRFPFNTLDVSFTEKGAKSAEEIIQALVNPVTNQRLLHKQFDDACLILIQVCTKFSQKLLGWCKVSRSLFEPISG